jgi:agmatinase
MTDLSPHRSVFLEDGAQEEFDRARVAILPVPYEATVSYGGGTAGGPQAILDASEQLELYDEQIQAEPFRCGVWTAPPLAIPAGGGEAVIRSVEERIAELLGADKWVVMLGGEHSITTGGVRAAAARHESLQVVQLDAHADLRDRYDGDPWSHACVMARCTELAPVRAIGIRSYSSEEAQRMREGIPGYRITHAWEMETEDWVEMALEGLEGRPVYLSIDVDYFDPSVIPSTGTPEPGGAGWRQTMPLLERLFRVSRVVCCDIVELAPRSGLHHADFTVARLVYKLIAYACGGAGASISPR